MSEQSAPDSHQHVGGLRRAEVLVEVGFLYDAELLVAALLDDDPDDLVALSLFAKIKHMRGQLSQAIACWARIYQSSPLGEAALMHLRSMLHLAQDPETGASNFLVLGQLALVRKTAAHLELEDAFRLFLNRRPDRARMRCRAIADRWRTVDREVYKLATLAEAWLAELSGELTAAVEILEALGEERGFEADSDRILGLVRLYERIGEPRQLEAAVYICQYLQSRHDNPSILARLAALKRRLGESDAARDYEAQYLRAFRRRMHRPTRDQAIEVAAVSYVPLSRLSRIAIAQTDETSEPSGTGVAVLHALRGELVAADTLLAASDAPLDAKYRGDVARMAGDDARAAELYAAAVVADPDDAEIAGQLLQCAPVDRLRELAVFEDSDVAMRVSKALDRAIRAAPLRPSLWRQMATLDDVLGEADRAEACRERATALAPALHRRSSAVGRVLAASVYHFVGRAKGLIHEVWADREPARPGEGGSLPVVRVHGNLTSEMEQSVHNVFLSVREYARTKFPHLTRDILDYDYTYKVTKEDEPSGGLSAELPTALAFLSVFVQLPVPQDLACSGAVIADAHDVLVLRAIGDAEEKVKGAYNRNLRALLLPIGNRNELSHSSRIPAEIHREVVRYAADLDEAFRIVFGDRLLPDRPHVITSPSDRAG